MAEHRQRFPVGIDLGTTNSIISYINDNGQPCALRNEIGDEITPSAILFEDKNILVGKEALKASAHLPKRFIDCFKRKIGEESVLDINGIKVPAEVCSAFLLAYLKKSAELQIGPIQDVVISVPAFFDENRRRSTQAAGRLAGLNVLDIINEPTAAAVCHAYADKKSCISEQGDPKTFLVYDLGGGTFDVTVLKVDGDNFQTIATDGDVYLGGKDFDCRLVDYLSGEFEKEHGFDPRENLQDMAQLWLDSEELKRSLSHRDEVAHAMFYQGLRCRVNVSRQKFEELTADLAQRTINTSKLVLGDAGLGWNDIDDVILVGGSSRIPYVKSLLDKEIGREIHTSPNADLMIGHGAAIYASMLYQNSKTLESAKSFSLVNVNSHSLGVVGVDAKTKKKINQIIIPKNTPLPTSATKKFVTGRDGQSTVRILVVEGESQDPDDCVELGSCVIRDLPPTLKKGSKVLAEFRYSTSGTVSISARCVETRQSASAIIQRKTSVVDLESLDKWVTRLTGENDPYLSKMNSGIQQKSSLQKLGAMAAKNKFVDADSDLFVLMQQISELKTKRKKLSRELPQIVSTVDKQKCLARIAKIRNQLKSLQVDLDYELESVGKWIVENDCDLANFPNLMEAKRSCLTLAS